MKKTKFGLLLALMILCLATLIGAAACGGGEGGNVKGTLKLDKTTVQLYVNGETATLRASLDPADKTAQYQWTVEDSKVASIAPTQGVCRVSPKKEGSTTVTVSIGNLTATCTVNVGPDQHVQLKAPSFTYDEQTGIISITDTVNAASEVGGYELQFFKEGSTTPSGSVAVKDGDVIDTRRIDKGEYTLRLVATGSSSLYLTSEPSESFANISIEKLMLYDLGVGDASCYNEEGTACVSDRWAYYTFDWVVASEAYCDDGEVTFSFSNNTSDNIKDYAWITQLIYSHGKTDSSKLYKMQLSINASKDCRISLNGKFVSLDEGDNLVTVAFKPDKDPLKCLFKIQFAIPGEPFSIVDGTVKIKRVGNILEATEQALKIPEFSFDDETKIITIVDDNNSKYDVDYTLGYFENMYDAMPKGTAVVRNGEAVDTSSVLSGEYYLKIMSATTGLPYTSSGWSAPDANAKITVKNTRVDMQHGGENDAKKNPGTWYYWFPTDNMNIGPGTRFDYAYINLNDDDSETIYLKYSNSGNYQPLKLFLSVSGYQKGDLYELSFTLESPMASKITVNGVVVDVVEGTNEISVVRVHTAPSGNDLPNTITIQLGAGSTTDVKGCISGEIVINDLQLKEADPIPLAQINSFNYSEELQAVTVDDPNDYVNEYKNAQVSYELGYYKGRTLVKTRIVADGDGFEHPNLAPGEYTLKLRIVPANALYVAEDWFEPATPIKILIDNPDYTEAITNGNTAAAANAPGTWIYYKDGKTANNPEIYIDAKQDIHLTFSVNEPTNQPIKLFYMDPDMKEGDLYTLSFTLNTTKAGYILVSDLAIPVEVGDNVISVTRKHLDPAGGSGIRNTVTIQFGASVSGTVYYLEGKLLLSNISWEKTEPASLRAIDFTFTADAQFTARDSLNHDTVANAYILGYFNEAGECVKEVTLNRGNVRNGVTSNVNTNNLNSGYTYTIKLRITTKDATAATDSDWFGPETPITYTKP